MVSRTLHNLDTEIETDRERSLKTAFKDRWRQSRSRVRVLRSKIQIKSKAKPILKIRQATLEDVPGIRAVELSAWGEDGAASEEKLRARILRYPRGQILTAMEVGGRTTIVGYVSGMRLTRRKVQEIVSWDQITDGGFITNHNPDGSYLYGVSLSVMKGHGDVQIGDVLLGEIADLVISDGIHYVLLGGRLPGFRRYNRTRARLNKRQLSVTEYAALKHDGKPRDSELRLYLSIPFMEIRGILPDYFPDEESENYGVLLQWSNPLYKGFFLWGLTYRLPFGYKLASKIAQGVKKLI